MLQAVLLVRDLAKAGKIDQQAFETCIYSLYQTEAKDTLAVYGGLNGLRYGLRGLVELLSKKKQRIDPDISRYFVSLMYLERKLYRDKKTQEFIRTKIAEAQKKADYFSPMHESMIAFFGDLYLNSISSFRFRIQIMGAKHHLTPQDHLNKIRALLLAGIRSAVLWRQLGGSRFQLIFYQQRLLRTAKELLAQSA